MRAMAEGAERQIRAPNAPQTKRKRSDPPEREGAGEGGKEEEFELEGEQRTAPTLPSMHFISTPPPARNEHRAGR